MLEIRRKTYVTVSAEHMPDGTCIPRWIMLPNTDEKYHISRVFGAERLFSPRTGGKGICFSILVDGKRTKVFYEGAGRWFVECK